MWEQQGSRQGILLQVVERTLMILAFRVFFVALIPLEKISLDMSQWSSVQHTFESVGSSCPRYGFFNSVRQPFKIVFATEGLKCNMSVHLIL